MQLSAIQDCKTRKNNSWKQVAIEKTVTLSNSTLGRSHYIYRKFKIYPAVWGSFMGIIKLAQTHLKPTMLLFVHIYSRHTYWVPHQELDIHYQAIISLTHYFTGIKPKFLLLRQETRCWMSMETTTKGNTNLCELL